ncbi:MAG: DNA-directed RNA polymerase subunit epsilon [Bombilactobacillus mellifer]|nr:DNA-directed RNA polymerase subunit epsilon [Bombilactobacillus mellifer]
MIYKVFYQEDPNHNPRRESTKSLYAEAKGIPELKEKLTAKYPYSIEYVTELDEESLEYEEKHNPDFKVLKDL